MERYLKHKTDKSKNKFITAQGKIERLTYEVMSDKLFGSRQLSFVCFLLEFHEDLIFTFSLLKD